MRHAFKWLSVALLFCASAHAQYNSRNWVNIQQQMTGAQPSMTSTPVSNFNALWPFKYYSLAVVTASGSPSWDVRLEGSNDGYYWSTLLINSSVTHSAGGPVFLSNASPALYLRVKAHSLTSGAQVTATAVGVP